VTDPTNSSGEDLKDCSMAARSPASRDRPVTAMETGEWLTYAQMGERFGLKPEAARPTSGDSGGELSQATTDERSRLCRMALT